MQVMAKVNITKVYPKIGDQYFRMEIETQRDLNFTSTFQKIIKVLKKEGIVLKNYLKILERKLPNGS